MDAEIVVTGSEILLGEIVDTNSSKIARRLREIGCNLYYISAVGDNEERMARVLERSLERSDLTVVSGGLGPTVDDVTRPAVARATGRELVFHPELLEQIEARFVRFGRPMTENNRRQAFVPAGAIVVENPVGTAPSFIVEDGRGTIICLPGVPRELEYLMEHSVIPYIREKMGEKLVIKAKVLRTCALGESFIDNLITDLMEGNNPTVGLAAHGGQVDIRITARASDETTADAMIMPVEDELRRRLGDYIYGTGEEKLADVVVRLLEERGMRLAVSDGALGGEVGNWLREVGRGDVLGWEEILAPSEHISEEERQKEAVERAVLAAGRLEYGPGLAIVGGRGLRTYVSVYGLEGSFTMSDNFHDSPFARRWLTVRSLDMVRRYLLGTTEYTHVY